MAIDYVANAVQSACDIYTAVQPQINYLASSNLAENMIKIAHDSTSSLESLASLANYKSVLPDIKNLQGSIEDLNTYQLVANFYDFASKIVITSGTITGVYIILRRLKNGQVHVEEHDDRFVDAGKDVGLHPKDR